MGRPFAHGERRGHHRDQDEQEHESQSRRHLPTSSASGERSRSPGRGVCRGSVAGMRRLLLLVAVLVFVDTMLFAALTPLLPHFAHEFALSKLRAGILVAAYPAGALIGGLPGGAAAARLGPRRAVIVGLVGMGLASLGFALAGGFWGLFAARLLQGLGSAFTWAGAFSWLLAAAPRDRRGQLLGSAMGAAVFGALFGPVIGAAAALAGRTAIFAALAGLSVVLVAATLRLEPAPVEHPSAAAIGRALRDYRFAAGLGLMALPSLLFGILAVLGPAAAFRGRLGCCGNPARSGSRGPRSRRSRRRSSAGSSTVAGGCCPCVSHSRSERPSRSASPPGRGRSSTRR